MKGLLRALNAQSPIAIAILRIVMGLIFLLAGYAKVFNGGFAVNAFRGMGVPLPELFGPVVSVLELGGGALLIVGVFTRILGVLYTIEFIVAALVIINLRGLMGARLEYMILVGAIVLATHGAGTLSLDRPGQKWEP